MLVNWHTKKLTEILCNYFILELRGSLKIAQFGLLVVFKGILLTYPAQGSGFNSWNHQNLPKFHRLKYRKKPGVGGVHL